MISPSKQLYQSVFALGAITTLNLYTFNLRPLPSYALPPASDIPEEVLRARPIAIGRSPLDNSPLSPSEYEQLQADLEGAQETRPTISPQLRRLITLLRLRKLLRSLNPFDS